MKKVNPVVERSRACLAPLGPIESRTQFGGYALAVESVVFALINKDELYLRASEPLRQYYRASASAADLPQAGQAREPQLFSG